MADLQTLQQQLTERFCEQQVTTYIDAGELTMELPREFLRLVCLTLRDDKSFRFNQLMDVCGVDYLEYGFSEWQTETTTLTGFSRAVNKGDREKVTPWDKPRFAAVYHLLSLPHNHRLRLRVFAKENYPMVDTVSDIWDSASWFEREAFDLYGILFNGHPDLRRILTDYGFVGHPFRKDFPLIGNVEMRYDASLQRCVYDSVSIQPRTLVPKVIRVDNRYLYPEPAETKTNG